MMIKTVGASLSRRLTLVTHSHYVFMKTDVAWLASSLAQTPLKNARILNEFPNGTHCLIPRQEKVRRFSYYRREGEIAGGGRGGGGRDGRRDEDKKVKGERSVV